MELKDKVVVITGGTKGFGRALAEFFVKEGSHVIICSHRKTVESIAKEMGVLGVKADVRQEDDMTTLAQFVINKFGHIDIWINNAGVWFAGFTEDMDTKDIKKMLDINVLGTINGSIVALRFMKEKNGGTIINIISKVALGVRPKLSVYVASKWAISGFTKTLREENKENKIKIFAVYPGGMKTSMYDKVKLETYDQYADPKDFASKVIDNLKKENPEPELVVLREGEKINKNGV